MALAKQKPFDHSPEKKGGNHKNKKHKDRFSSHDGDHSNSSSISQNSNNRLFTTAFINSVANIKLCESIANSKINISLYQEHIQNSSTL